MASYSDRLGPPTTQGVAGWVWRVVVAVVAPPMVTLAVFFLGRAVSRLDIGCLLIPCVVLPFLAGPGAIGAGLAVALGLNPHLFREARYRRGIVPALSTLAMIAAFFAWSVAVTRYIKVGR